MEDIKQGGTWEAQPGFGGTALIYPMLISEGHFKRGLPLQRVAELVAAQPAQTVGLYPRKGTIAVGRDADLTVVDPELGGHGQPRSGCSRPRTTRRSRASRSRAGRRTPSARGASCTRTAKSSARPDGRYLKRPDALHSAAEVQSAGSAEAT